MTKRREWTPEARDNFKVAIENGFPAAELRRRLATRQKVTGAIVVAAMESISIDHMRAEEWRPGDSALTPYQRRYKARRL